MRCPGRAVPVAPVVGVEVPSDARREFNLYATVSWPVDGVAGVDAAEPARHLREVVDYAVVVGERAPEVAGQVVGERSVGAAQEHGEEVVVAAVAVDRDDRLDPFEKGSEAW